MKVQLWSIFSKQLPFYYPRKSKKNIPIHWFLPNVCSQWSTNKLELDTFLTWLSSNLSLFPQNTNISAKFVKNYLRTNNTLGSPKFFDFTCKKLFACQSDRVDNQNKRFTVETNKIAEKNKSCKFFKKSWHEWIEKALKNQFHSSLLMIRLVKVIKLQIDEKPFVNSFVNCINFEHLQYSTMKSLSTVHFSFHFMMDLDDT